MREILFKGKRVDNGEWVEGSLFQDIDSGYFVIEYFDYYTDESGLQKDFCQYNVIPETVGQFTGLNDKNGRKIFEWDIVKEKVLKQVCPSVFKKVDEISIVKFKDGMFSHCTQPLGKFEVEIIGNIHDNPELLKEENNGKS